MKIYVVAGRYLRTQDDARKHARDAGVPFNPDKDFDDVPVSPAADLVAYLNDLVEGLVSGGTLPTPVVDNVVPLHSSVMVDEAFEGLPITHQLTLTALALENARAEIVRLTEGQRGGVVRHAGLTPAESEYLGEIAATDDDADEFV